MTRNAYEQLVCQLESRAEQDLSQFNQRLIPGVRPCLGVRTAVLRAAAKDILNGDPLAFLDLADGRYQELMLLRAIVLAALPLPDALPRLKEFIPLIDNWAVCDTLCHDFKAAGRCREAVWDFLTPYFTAKDEFALRFAAVLLLWHYTIPAYTPAALEFLASVRHEGYYANMGVAWAAAEFYTKEPALTLPLLVEKRLPPWTHNKAIQKICESCRISPQDKAKLRPLKV